MFIVIGVLFALIVMILIWFHIPYSPVKRGSVKLLPLFYCSNLDLLGICK